jgi:hypothetical protein
MARASTPFWRATAGADGPGADATEALSGVDLPKEIGGRRIWIQTGEDLAHRDVLIDDIVTDFFKRVGWITLPILLVLLAIDIVIFRRALRPLLQASKQAQSIGPTRTDVTRPCRGRGVKTLEVFSSGPAFQKKLANSAESFAENAVNEIIDLLECMTRTRHERQPKGEKGWPMWSPRTEEA